MQHFGVTLAQIIVSVVTVKGRRKERKKKTVAVRKL